MNIELVISNVTTDGSPAGAEKGIWVIFKISWPSWMPRFVSSKLHLCMGWFKCSSKSHHVWFESQPHSLLRISSWLCSDFCVFFLSLELWKVLTCNIYNKLYKVIRKKWTTSQRGTLLILGQFLIYRRLKNPSKWKCPQVVGAIYEGLICRNLKVLLLHWWSMTLFSLNNHK